MSELVSDEVAQQWQMALAAALADLSEAVEELERKTVPPVPLPRPRRFRIAPGITWSGGDQLQVASKAPIRLGMWSGRTFRSEAESILEAVRYRPRAVLRALRRLQAAAAWCRARRAGRLRAAQEILRQQSRAVEVLEAEAAMAALAKRT